MTEIILLLDDTYAGRRAKEDLTGVEGLYQLVGNIDELEVFIAQPTESPRYIFMNYDWLNAYEQLLERQKEIMTKKYPEYLIIEEIGSGLNLNKRGIKKIIHLAIQGKVKELVVAYRDRLTRFGYELIEELIHKYSNGKITVLSEQNKLEPEEELVKDIMAIMNVYVAKMNGLRKYKKLKNT